MNCHSGEKFNLAIGNPLPFLNDESKGNLSFYLQVANPSLPLPPPPPSVRQSFSPFSHVRHLSEFIVAPLSLYLSLPFDFIIFIIASSEKLFFFEKSWMLLPIHAARTNGRSA